MRWIFLFVFSLNLAYIAWEMNRSPSDDYTHVAALKNVQPIVLLSELKQQQGDFVKSGQESAEVTVAADENVSADSVDGKLADPEEERTAQVVLADKTPQVKPEVVTIKISEQVPEVKQAEIKKQPDQVVTSPEKTEPVKVVTKSSQAASCYTLGPFRDLDKLRGLTREIKSYVVKADFRGREEKEQTLYWVYVKPEKNRTQAIATGKRLKAKKIKDFYVIRDGDKVNGLSLGHFRSKDGAYGLAKKVTKLGFDVLVEPVFRSYTIYWLDYQLSSGVSIPESIFEQYTQSDSKDKISRLSRDCGT